MDTERLIDDLVEAVADYAELRSELDRTVEAVVAGGNIGSDVDYYTAREQDAARRARERLNAALVALIDDRVQHALSSRAEMTR